MIAGGVTSLVAIAFVPKINDAGIIRRWHFENPPPSVSENVFNRTTRAIRFSISKEAYSEPHREAERNAVRTALGQWEAIPNSVLQFEEGPLASDAFDINPNDGTNIVKWAKNTTIVNGGKTDIRGRLGLAFTLFFADGKMAGFDIVLNGVEHSWFADPVSPIPEAFFIEGTVTHEIGHVLGLEHTPMGAGSMFARDGSGLGFQSGLTGDEISFVQSVYRNDDNPTPLSILEGEITMNGDGVLGAALFLETMAGDIVASTVSQRATGQTPLGFFRFQGIHPGTYQLRAQPLDSASAARALVKGRDISFSRFDDAEVDFRPTEPLPVTLTSESPTSVQVTLDSTPPAFRIDRIRQFTANPNGIRSNNSPAIITQGDQNLTLGVFGLTLPTSNVELLMTGDGLSLGPTEVTTRFFSGLPHLFRKVSVAEDATPGIRSFIVRQGDQKAYASGFLEVRAADPDDNFDGLSDAFQRQHFPAFTSSAAAPDADPDEDGLTNQEEFQRGTDPNNPNNAPSTIAPFPILAVSLSVQGASVTFKSTVGIRYELFARDTISAGSWIPVGSQILGDGTVISLLDPTATQDIRFYEVRTSN